MTRIFRPLLAAASLGLLACSLSVPSASAAPSPGGWSPVSTDDPGVRDAAQVAVRQLSTQVDARYVVEEIRQASEQVVAGINYKISFRAAELVGDELTTRYSCDAVVWVKPWENSTHVTSLHCGPEPR